MKLSEKAMLVHISGHMWTGRRKDKSVSNEVCVLKNAETDAGAWWTYLVSPKELRPISVARSRVDRMHKSLTLPWLDGNLRILVASMFMEYRDKMKPPFAAYHTAVAAFAKRFPELIANAPKRLGKLDQKLPTSADIAHRFRLEQDILPLPEIADFRVDAGDEETKEIQTLATSSLEAAMKRSVMEVWSRLNDLVTNVASAMSEPDRKFHDSLIKKLDDFCKQMPKFNITDDADLEKVRKDVMSRLASLDPEDLREIPNNRKKAAKDAKDVMAKISDYMK